MKNNIFPVNFSKYAMILLSASLISGCENTSAISEQTRQFQPPKQWSSTEKPITEDIQPLKEWLAISDDQALSQLISLAHQHNFELRQAELAVEQAKLQVDIENSSDFPELSLTMNQSRRKSLNNGSSSINNNAELSLNLSYELDLWGKLSDQQQMQQLRFAAEKANYQHAKLSLHTSVVTAWYDLLENETLLKLYQERLVNLKNNQEIIQGGYRLGLNSALDVYLSQNELHSEQARVQRQMQSVIVAKRALQLLIGEYPTGMNQLLVNEKAWPILEQQLSVEVPSSVLTNRSDLTASWLELMALDSALAVAHKQRFPQISLSASAQDSSDELGNLLSGDPIGWSLIGNVAAPLFNAGRLKANEERARVSVLQKEQAYLAQLYNAFSQVESQLDNHYSLSNQLNLQLKAQENAQAAEELAFNQYQKGLVSYTTVLEAQRRAFDNQTASIQLKSNLIKNRIALFLSMGGQSIVDTEIEQAGL